MAASRSKGFTPFRPPWGTYDPSLDAQGRQAQRGYGDLQSDWGTDANGNPMGRLAKRAQSEYGLTVADLQRQGTQATQDFGTQRAGIEQSGARSLADILTSRSRGAQDNATALSGIHRGYAQQGAAQTTAAASQGVGGMGTLAAALQARSANQGRDVGAQNQAYGRFQADSAQAETRLGQDQSQALQGVQTQQDRTLGPDGSLARAFVNAGKDYTYGVGDKAVELARAGRENTSFQTDLTSQKLYQGQQSGLLPGRGQPGGPASNEFVDSTGPYRVILHGGQRLKQRPDGSLEPAGRRR